MSAKKDRVQAANSRTNGADLKRAVSWVFNASIFDEVRLHGNVNWTALALVQLAVLWVWSPESSLVLAADAAVELARVMFGAAPVGSYQALTNALKRYSVQLLPILWRRLQSLMEQCDEDKWRVGLSSPRW